MGFFGFNKKNKNVLQRLSQEDKQWVEEGYSWMIEGMGYPSSEDGQILFTKENFPETFSAEKILPQNLIVDLCRFFNVPETKVSFQFVSDLRDTYMVPYETDEPPFESELVRNENDYTILLAQKIQDHPGRMIYLVVYEFIKIALYEAGLEFDNGEDTLQFVFLAGILFGFGIILSSNLRDVGQFSDGTWETHWAYAAPIREEVLAYAMALFAQLTGNHQADWISFLSPSFRVMFEAATEELKEHPSAIVNDELRNAVDLFRLATDNMSEHKYDKALSLYKELLSKVQNHELGISALSNAAFCCLRMDKHEEALSYLTKILKAIPDDLFALDNMAYVLIKLRKTDEAKTYLEKSKAIQMSPVVMVNFALYHQAMDETAKAEEYFALALKLNTIPDGYVEYSYACFLNDDGQHEKALEYLWKSHDCGNYDASQELRRINRINEFGERRD
jgi:tetratricopeptide (TPR) repeat protein